MYLQDFHYALIRVLTSGSWSSECTICLQPFLTFCHVSLFCVPARSLTISFSLKKTTAHCTHTHTQRMSESTHISQTLLIITALFTEPLPYFHCSKILIVNKYNPRWFIWALPHASFYASGSWVEAKLLNISELKFLVI